MGACFGGVGAFLFLKGARRVLRERRLRAHGTLTDGTITAVSPTRVSFNRQQQWAVSYEYRDHVGRAHRGQSGYLSPMDAQHWKPGDVGKVRFDREQPHDSIWLGDELS